MPFHPDVRLIAAARTGGICSNPSCMRYLLGPSKDSYNKVDIFEAAHIVSSKDKGPRYEYLENFDYDSIENCIALCRACHRLVDHSKNCTFYSKEMLQSWKLAAEDLASLRIGTPINAPFFDPIRERSTRDVFLSQFWELAEAHRWHNRLAEGIIHRSVHRGLKYCVNGQSLRNWDHYHSLRSHNSLLSYHQDHLMLLTKKSYQLLSQSSWQNWSWLGDSNFLSCSDTITRTEYIDSSTKLHLQEIDASIDRVVAQILTIQRLPI